MPNPICWIDHVSYTDADADLRSVYDQVLSPGGHLDKLYQGFSLSPQTILPADKLYRATLHHPNNVLDKAFSELAGTFVAILAGCDYAKAHHGQNFIHLSDNPGQAQNTLDALSSGHLELCGDHRCSEALRYVRKLCLRPAETDKTDINRLREVGWNDKEISEIVQVVAMFSYFVRVINGVGIEPGGEKIGLY